VNVETPLEDHGLGAAGAAFHECFAIVTLAFALALVPAGWIARR